MKRPATRKGRRAQAGARRTGPPLRRRLRVRVPAFGRFLALLALGTLVGGLLVLINAPWLRIADVAWAGQRYTPGYQLERILGPLRGSPMLSLDGAALQRDLQRLPSVESVSVEASLPDRLQVTLVEKAAAFVWRTKAVQMICAADGTVIGQVALRLALPADLAALPFVDDRRPASRNVLIGDRVDPAEMRIALRLTALVPAMLGSATTQIRVAIDDENGFLLTGVGVHWKAALGRLGVGLSIAGEDVDRVAASVAAIRTLLSIEPEDSVSWIDVRNPGKVYWRS